ncbi:MAG: YdhR family protein, partial [Planctomycetes bacterium]|nr:YdhR family protein [Planctomycetota bacterium]
MSSPHDVALRGRIIVSVRFRTELPVEEMQRRYLERLPLFQALSGLVQKYYVYDEGTGEWGGIYVWDSMESVQAYMQSDLRKSIGRAWLPGLVEEAIPRQPSPPIQP